MLKILAMNTYMHIQMCNICLLELWDKVGEEKMLDMKFCPICGEKLEKGYIGSVRGIYFTKNKSKSKFAFVKEEEDITLAQDSLFLSYADAFICTQCKCTFVPYVE